MASSSPLPTEGDPLRSSLLDAAARVFARQGYDGTKILDIVREAGLSTGAVYGRFRSKGELLRAAVIRGSGAAARLTGDDVERVADLVARGASHTDGELTDAEALRLEAYVTARREPEVAQALGEARDRWRAAVEPLLQAAQRDGTIREDLDPEAVLFLVRVLNLGLLLHRGSGLPGPHPAAWAKVVEGVVASFGEPTTPTPAEGGPPGAPADPPDRTELAPSTDIDEGPPAAPAAPERETP